MGSSLFSDSTAISNYPVVSGICDLYEGEKSSLGFIELLGVQDPFGHNYCSTFDHLPKQTPSLTTPMSSVPNNITTSDSSVKEMSSEVLNQPATPNSSSVSSGNYSSEALNDEHAQVQVKDQEEAEKEPQKNTKQLKGKKTNQKRQREPRFAFMTKSEVDHLEDGYRWRKYGQKAVKNSPFPRSYYRCTTAACNVKKRVERSFSNPTVVVTTYEGQHTHPSPVMVRPCLAGAPTGFNVSDHGITTANFAMPMPRSSLSNYNQQQQFLQVNNLSPGLSSNFGYGNSSNANNDGFVHERSVRFRNPGPGLLSDHGLLQDIIPSNMLKLE